MLSPGRKLIIIKFTGNFIDITVYYTTNGYTVREQFKMHQLAHYNKIICTSLWSPHMKFHVDYLHLN